MNRSVTPLTDQATGRLEWDAHLLRRRRRHLEHGSKAYADVGEKEL